MNERKIFMKKITALFLSILLILGLAACNSTDSDKNKNSVSKTNSQASESVSSKVQPSDGKNVLVVYFSASGNTERVAKSIASAANADLFEIVPQKAYTSDDLDWTDDNSRVSREHDDESLRDVQLKTTTVENWSDYDTVLIGYPIWWGVAAWPVNTFVKSNDFTDKTVIPFCTSASSSLGQSGKKLSDLAKGGNWQEGQRFSSNASDDEIKDFVSSFKTNK